MRQQKTSTQRAEEQLAITDRAVDRLTKKRDELAADLAVVEYDLEAAVVRRDYLANHPDLPQNPTTKAGATP